jgi:hypothetical protein
MTDVADIDEPAQEPTHEPAAADDADLAPVAARLAAAAHLFADQTADQASRTVDARSALREIDTARALHELSGYTLRAAVAQARAAGRTWQEISEVLGTTRQAAFQRFGKPMDPRTGEAMSNAIIPNAGQRAEAITALWVAGDWPEAYAATQPVTAEVDERLNPKILADALAQVVGMVGAYQSMGEAVVSQRGDHTVVDIPLEFEAGSMKSRVAFDPEGRTAGLFILRPDAL